MQIYKKPKIALVIDSESWAFSNISRQIVRHLDHRFDFKIIATEVVSDIEQILLMTADCDVTHFFWREYLNLITHNFSKENIRSLGYDPVIFLKKYVLSRVITTSVYDHLFLLKSEIEARRSFYNEFIKGYTVSSQRLMNIYRNIKPYPDPTQLAEDGVDLTLFKPDNLERLDSLGQRTLVIGWAGNSKWWPERGEDFKGLHTILAPAVEQLLHEGLDVRLELADRQQGFIPHTEMQNYYAKLDIYVCTSQIEGTPNPVLEAMACGVPVISTDVGVVPQAFDGDPYKLILDDRSIDAITTSIRKIHEGGPKLAKAISAYNLRAIEKWDWSYKIQNFSIFFDSMIRKKKEFLESA